MNRHSIFARVGAPGRRALYEFVSLLVIASMLARPVTAIAMIYHVENELERALTARSTTAEGTGATLPVRSTRPLATGERSRRATLLPTPALRTLAQVNPTPSNAKPAYPNNHILDGAYQAIGTPPTNYDFETAATGGGAPPANHDFAAASYTVGTPPTNHNFESGDLSGWSTTGTVTIQSDGTHGYYAQLTSSGVLISDAFTVDSAAQTISFAANYVGSTGFRVYILSGAGYATRTEIVYLACTSCGWVNHQLDPAAYLGQSIKVEFKRIGGTLGIDDLRMDVVLPSYQISKDV
ncbi:MAG: hypothetical protein KDE58_21100, partial [Caldilineaceae bacterium]|nr:hypothetical protein [Caldilineaceae bacterium]